MKPDSNVEEPCSWPRAATPCDLAPRWAGEFRDHGDWVSFASSRLTGCRGSNGEEVKAICVDTLGRRCNSGGDMARARDESAFPVRYFWECAPSAELHAKELTDLRNQNARLVDTIAIHHENFEALHARAELDLNAGDKAHADLAYYVWLMTHPDPARRGPGD